MTKDKYGTWEIVIPPKDGQCAIPHDSKLKVRISPADPRVVRTTHRTHPALARVDIHDFEPPAN
jgi:hypothetical protein